MIVCAKFIQYMDVKWLIHESIAKAIGDFDFTVPAFETGDFYIEDVDSTVIVHVDSGIPTRITADQAVV